MLVTAICCDTIGITPLHHVLWRKVAIGAEGFYSGDLGWRCKLLSVPKE